MTGILTPVFGEDLAPIANLVVGFLIIVLAIFVCLWVWRKVSGGSFAVGTRVRKARLGVMESASVDSRRRLILVRRDNVGHLILTGGPSDLVVENNIDLSEQKTGQPQRPAETAVEPSKAEARIAKVARIDQQAPKPVEPAPRVEKAVEAAPPAPKAEPKPQVPTELTSAPVVGAATVLAGSQVEPAILPDHPVQVEAPDHAVDVAADTTVTRSDPPMETTEMAAEITAPAIEPDVGTPESVADVDAAHELDPELLQELQATLYKKPEAASAGTDVTLEREMSKLLNNLSTDRSG